MDSGKTVCSALLVGICLSLGLVHCAPDGGHGGAWIHTTQQLIKRGEMQYCGSHLVEAVRNLCQGNYAALTRRSDPALANMGASYDEDTKNVLDKLFSASISNEYATDLDSDNWDGQDNALSADFDTIWPKNPKTLAVRILTEGVPHHRVRRSLIDECCKRPCRVGQMLKYCGGMRQ